MFDSRRAAQGGAGPLAKQAPELTWYLRLEPRDRGLEPFDVAAHRMREPIAAGLPFGDDFEVQALAVDPARPPSSDLDRERCGADWLAYLLPKEIQPSQTRTDQTSRKLRQARGTLCKPPKCRG